MKFLSNKPLRAYCPSIKAVIFGIILSGLAVLPILSTFLPNTVDYSETTKSVKLVPGWNKIDNVVITIDQSGKVVLAKQIKPQIGHQFFGFRNFRTFLTAGIPFLSLLGFCVFFFWYDKQPKTPDLLTLKRYTWRAFSFVSLWFIYWIIVPASADLSYATCSLCIYLLTGISLALVHNFHLYYCKSFSRRHRKTAGLISHIFDIRYGHFPPVVSKALQKKEARKDSCKRLGHYEDQTFDALDELNATPTLRNAKFARPKLVVIGLLLSVLAIAPLCYQFASKRVDYVEKAQTVLLVPGLNKIGSLSITLDKDGKVIKAEKTERHVIHKVFTYENMKVFLWNISPFITSLSLCLFFFWYEQQEKNPHVLALKRYVLTIFLLVSLWCAGWAVIPEHNPIPDNFYYIGAFVALCVGVASLQYLYRHNSGGFTRFYSKLRGLVIYIFAVRREHYPTIAWRALEHMKSQSSTTHNSIEVFDECSIMALIQAMRLFPVEDEDLKQGLLDLEEELLQRVEEAKRRQGDDGAKSYLDRLIKWRKKSREEDEEEEEEDEED